MPNQGGAIATFSVKGEDKGWFELFDTRPDPSRTGPFALGCNILAPFSNRISGGGFFHDGEFHRLEPNIAGEPYPNHGNAFSLPWRILRQAESEVVLALTSDGPGPFRYAAQLTYRLTEGSLTASLILANSGHRPLPFGGGFHPWFPRRPGSRLRFAAAGVWTEKADHLPERYLALDKAGPLDFTAGAELPDGFVNVAYAGWDGWAELEWPDAGMGLRLEADRPLDVLMFYTPGRKAGFFSLEPVSHTVDAHNRHGEGVVRPQVLAPGESITLSMRLIPHAI